MSMARIYYAALNKGMDKEITLYKFLLFDDFTNNNIDELRKDTKANIILKKPINELNKIDIDYVLSL